MNYSGSSPIKGAGTATAAQIDAWMQYMGQALAPDYAPDHRYKQPPDLGLTIINLCAEVGVNSDLVSAQICKESAGWQSAIVRAKNNPSGLGAENDNPYEKAATFDTPADGIKATIAHLLTYVVGRGNPWWSFDPRATAVPGKNLGVVQVLSDLDGRWAVPGDGYGAGIAQLANQLVATGGTSVATLWYPEAKRASTPYQNDGASNGRRFPATVTDVVMHHTDGSYASAISWFEETGRGSGGTSAHFVISRTGEVTQLVALDAIAWHAGNWDENVKSIGIEHEQSQVNGQWQDWPDALLDASAKLLTWLMGQMTAGFNVYPHKNFTSTTCPGNLPIDEIVKRIGQPATQALAQPAAKPDTRWFPETRHYLSHGFLRFWEENGGLAIFGLPLSEEFTGPEGFTVQWLERAQFQYQPTIASNQWGVVLARIGADAMANDRNKNPQAFADAEPPK